MKKTIACLAALSILGGTAVFAQDSEAVLKARQGQFRILALNLGVLGGMAKGSIEYNADAAQAAADSIVGVSMVHQATLFPEGTDAMSIEGTRAEPAIWENFGDFESKWAALGEAAASAQNVVAGGKDAVGPALGQLGGACKACHDTYRAPE
ncbi:c-type cytochrome [Primorskyibacter sp. 2E107]|uniref:c-type cytochrome n=1 Tax=Primorskyibacter sp. 2E107 TaxID=3403458 RepID=UPI003AF5A697